MARFRLCALAALLCLFALPAAARATDLTVTTVADDVDDANCTVNSCTLRQAVKAAAGHTNQHIHLDGNLGSYELDGSYGPLVIANTQLTIDTTGDDEADIIGDAGVDIFKTDSSAGNVDLSIDNALLRHGSDTDGRALTMFNSSNSTKVLITNSDLSGNRAAGSGTGGGFGGAIFNKSGELTIEDSSISFNSASAGTGVGAVGGGAGAIGADTGTITIRRSNIQHNEAEAASPGGGGNGGAIYVADSTLAIEDTMISDNSTGSGTGVPASRGGALYLDTDTTTIDGSAISNNGATGGNSSDSGNSSGGQGGGLYAGGGSLTATNSTIGENTAAGTSGNGGGMGGGMLLHGGIVATLDQVTVAGNAAGGSNGSGGNITIFQVNPLNLKNTIIANGTASLDRENCSPSPNSAVGDYSGQTINKTGRNMEDRNQCALRSSPDDKPSTDPLLNNLSSHGGFTDNFSISSTSPARDAAVDCDVTVDQRGRHRPSGSGCDIGSYEYVPGQVQANDLGFGDVGVADGAVGGSVTVGNPGDSAFTIASVVLGGPDAADFGLVNDACSGEFMTPGEECFLDVAFDPSSAGAKSATLTIAHNGANGPTSIVHLTGNGTVPGGGGPIGGSGAGAGAGAVAGTTQTQVKKKKKAKCSTKKKKKHKKAGKSKKKKSCGKKKQKKHKKH